MESYESSRIYISFRYLRVFLTIESEIEGAGVDRSVRMARAAATEVLGSTPCVFDVCRVCRSAGLPSCNDLNGPWES